jgi:hypothetical protein
MHKDEEERDLLEDAEWRLSRGDHSAFRAENARAAVIKRLLLEVVALREVCPQLSLEDEPRRRGRTIPSMLAECEDLEALVEWDGHSPFFAKSYTGRKLVGVLQERYEQMEQRAVATCRSPESCDCRMCVSFR